MHRSSARPRSPQPAALAPVFGVLLAVGLLAALFTAGRAPAAQAGSVGNGGTKDSVSTAPASAPFQGTTNAPQVHVVLTLGNVDLHPRELVYDAPRDGLWFWTSTLLTGPAYANTLYFYHLPDRRLQSWPLYSGDWSSQLLSGLAVAPNGIVWIGWNHNLVAFDPTHDTATRYLLPAQPRYPLPAAVLGNLPADLGIADLAVSRDGTVWIARYAALSLTTFTPATGRFAEYPLPSTTGDPAKLAIAPNGHILFTTDLAASHPGHGEQTVGDFDPASHAALVTVQTGRALVVTSAGDVYVGVGQGQGLARLSTATQATAWQQGRSAVFAQHLLPFDVGDSALAADAQGHIWVAVAGQPDVAVYNPASGALHQYQYAALSVTAHPAIDGPVGVQPVPPTTSTTSTAPAPGAVWLTPIVAMVCDGQGDLWYIRAGSDVLEEVTP